MLSSVRGHRGGYAGVFGMRGLNVKLDGGRAERGGKVDDGPVVTLLGDVGRESGRD